MKQSIVLSEMLRDFSMHKIELVTADDYESIIRRIYPAVADIVCFGGEDADPPEYGKVKIVVKPSFAVGFFHSILRT